jgi:hypothetical protein
VRLMSSAQKRPPTSTVGRRRPLTASRVSGETEWRDEAVSLQKGDSAMLCTEWPTPTVIVSDGGYGVLGFEGDTSDHLGLPEWYEPHIAAWSAASTPCTTLWFWNSEIGWAAVHPVLERYGWRYVNANVWNKGKGHIAGNVNTQRIRRFPVVTELCVQYIFEARVGGSTLREWLLSEWKRTGLPVKTANEACGVRDAAVRKYFDQGHLWYFPPPDKFAMLATFANEHGDPQGRPYYSRDGTRPMTGDEWSEYRSKFNCPHGVTNVWDRSTLRGDERIKVMNGKAVHLNQKPLDLMSRIVEAASDVGDVVWEPFGGLFTASLAAGRLGRRAFGGEIDETYFAHGMERIKAARSQPTC